MAAPLKLNKDQSSLARAKLKTTIFLEGPAGTGKTSAAVARLGHLLDSNVRADSILVLLPQLTLGTPYRALLDDPTRAAGGEVTLATIGGLARRMVELFWPLVAERAGFRHPDRRPTFLSLETSQYFMARVVGPSIEREGWFETVSIDRNRLYSQILDNLNKAAIVGFPHTQIGERLREAWRGDPAQQRMYEDAQRSAELFRAYCLENNLLDFSLEMEIFMRYLWNAPECRDHLTRQYRHLIVDNVEEDNPALHQVLADWLPLCESALVIYDSDAGYRRFLGADPVMAYRLKPLCERKVTFEKSFVTSPDLRAFGEELTATITPNALALPEDDEPAVPSINRADGSDPRAALVYDNHRYHPEMVDWVADEIRGLVQDHGVKPGEIVVLAPYLSDALRFSLMNRLQAHNIPAQSHRPSRSLREEPATIALLTLAQLAHPGWNLRPASFDVIYALMEAIDGLDLVRAQMLGRMVYKFNTPTNEPHATPQALPLLPFDQIKADDQERITFEFGNRYAHLRAWLEVYAQGEAVELDVFLSRLFGEVLSQEGYGFHNDFDAAATAANLIDSARKFRWIITESGATVEGKSLAQEYVEMVGQGIIADQYLRRWELEAQEAVLVAPAYTFLLSNRPVDYQFWLNVGGQGWAERLYQPLTNPYVLSAQWPPFGRPDPIWTDEDEVRVSAEALQRVTLGLVRRCRRQIYLGFSELGEQGYEQRGALLEAIQRILRRYAAEAGA
ncbi:MAG: hypothetical protein SF029_10210 [bacterium]|nr:hypothetical protein [bacterium]